MMDQSIIDLYNDYIHGDMPRRSFLRRVTETAGGAALAWKRTMNFFDHYLSG